MFHTEIADKWNSYSIFTQMANIGAEVGRAINWKRKEKQELSKNAMYRALELIDLTVADGKNRKRLKEILRIREVFLDFMIGENIYKVTDKEWEKYFYYFTIAARPYHDLG